MRISDWSSDVCSSDLSNDRVSVWIIGWFLECRPQCGRGGRMIPGHRSEYDPFSGFTTFIAVPGRTGAYSLLRYSIDRKSVVTGKRVAVRVDLGGRRIVKKTKR